MPSTTTQEIDPRAQLRADAREIERLVSAAAESLENAAKLARTVETQGLGLPFTFGHAIEQAAAGIASDIAGETQGDVTVEGLVDEARDFVELVDRLTGEREGQPAGL